MQGYSTVVQLNLLTTAPVMCVWFLQMKMDAFLFPEKRTETQISLRVVEKSLKCTTVYHRRNIFSHLLQNGQNRKFQYVVLINLHKLEKYSNKR